MRLLLNLQSGLAWCSVAKWRYKPVMPQELLAKIIFHRTKKFKMKYSFPGMLFCLVLLACHGNLTAQKSIPSVEIKTLNGQAVNIKDYTHKGEKITILSFWASRNWTPLKTYMPTGRSCTTYNLSQSPLMISEPLPKSPPWFKPKDGNM